MMRFRTAAMLLASVLLLTGCGKTTVVDSTPSDSSTFTDADVSSGAPQEDVPGNDAQGSSKAAQESSVSDASGSSSVDAAKSTDAAGQQITPHGGEDDQEGDYSTAGTRAGGDTASGNAGISGNGGNTVDAKLYITVETVEITVDELAEQDYTVPLIINLDKNPGINYSEWGLKLDDRCTDTANTKGMDFSTVSYINDDRHFLWTAWTSGADSRDYDGTLLRLNVTVPKDAAPGTVYKIEYAEHSLADGSHIWSDGTNDWVAQNTVGWTDGGVVIK